MTEVDFEVLKDEGRLMDEVSFEDLDEALSTYKNMHEALTLASEVLYGEEGESFAFDLHITSSVPYIITSQIYLI